MDLIEKDTKLWLFLNDDLRAHIEDGYSLIELTDNSSLNFHDYSFCVFPFAKAYEGFLKVLFLKLGLITQKDFEGTRLRIGRELNPSFRRPFFRTRSVYGGLSSYFRDLNLAEELWMVWKKGRNLLFHYFPHQYQVIGKEEAKAIVFEMLSVMEKAVENCKFKDKPKSYSSQYYPNQQTNNFSNSNI